MRLEEELKVYGCDLDPDEFRDIVQELFAVMFPAWTDEKLARNPRDALRYCDAVRSRCRCGGLQDDTVIGTLFNCRKDARELRAI